MNVLGLDFETTWGPPGEGVDPKKSRIIEAGAVLWDTARKQPLRIYNQVCPWLPEFGPFDERVTGLTGLTEEDLNKHGRPTPQVLLNLVQLMGMADAVVAHNGTGFDKPVFFTEIGRHGIELPEAVKVMPWYDTSCDVPYPKDIETRKLQFLAPAHGFLNPFSHRAIFDVLSMLKVMSNYDVAEIHRRATAQKVKIRAMTSKPWEDGGKSNQAAKDRGFRFDGDVKLWTKIVLADEVEAEIAAALPLKVVVLT
jgi:DNA polymerase-3 subunit epsilon